MTRVLQLRRGTAAQNDNFTGMMGEVTFDTDAKTIRVHDGETLGGYSLARAGATDGDGEFDITDVSDEFWGELFTRFSTTETVLTGTMSLMNNASYNMYGFETTLTPKFATVDLVCQTPECGYTIGDVVSAYGTGNIPATRPNILRSEHGVMVQLMSGGDAFWVAHHDTGIRTEITAENWQLLFRLYC